MVTTSREPRAVSYTNLPSMDTGRLFLFPYGLLVNIRRPYSTQKIFLIPKYRNHGNLSLIERAFSHLKEITRSQIIIIYLFALRYMYVIPQGVRDNPENCRHSGTT